MKFELYVFSALIMASSVHAQIEPDAATVSYLSSKSFGEMTVFYGMMLDKSILDMDRCPGAYGFEPVTFSILEPLKFAAGNTHPLAGKWTYRFNFRRCGTEKIYNAMWQARSGAMPMPAALPPGMSRSDLSLAMTIKNVVASAGIREFGVPQECRAIRVLDTRVTLQPTQLNVGDVVRDGVWEEEWTANMCGVEFKAPICLMPLASGRGTNWIARACPK